MKFISLFIIALLAALLARGQAVHEVSGTITDSTKTTLPGSTVKLTSDGGDSTEAVANLNGRFLFTKVAGTKVTITVSLIGFQTIRKHYLLDKPGTIDVGQIVLKVEGKMLAGVTINGTPPIRITDDTITYKVSAFPVRANAPIADAISKMPGVDVDPNTGAVTAQGQSVTKVRLNNRDYNGGDVASLIRSLPADLAEDVQIVDDYGDLAAVNGMRTGQSTKVLNINIRKDRNYGYSLQSTAGGGADLLPAPETDDGRYLANANLFDFKGDRQISLQGNLNNTNVNTFTFNSGSSGFGGSGAGGNFGGSAGGGRGNAARSTGSTSTTNTNGITDARALGGNYSDNWGKKLQVYGSYNFADNSTYTNSYSNQQTTTAYPSQTLQKSVENDGVLNHRFNWNMVWKPDTVNYFKIVPNYTYSRTTTTETDNVTNMLTSQSTGALYTNTAYTSNTYANSTAPTAGLNVLYNHRFNSKGRNFSIYLITSIGKTDQYQNPVYTYTTGTPTAPVNQQITTNSVTNSLGATFSYIEPVGKAKYLELNYAYNRSYTSSDKVTDTLSANSIYTPYALLSNDYNFTFVTNRIGLNYRSIEKKYNYVLGVGVQPASLDGYSVTTGMPTSVTTVNFSPTARFTYNFARSNTLSINYNGNNDQPSFSQLQPVIDYSNALYPVQGNPDLKPDYTNNLSIRYNKFSFETGNVLFTNFSYTQTDDKVVSNLIAYPRKFSAAVVAADPGLKQLEGTNLTQYLNANGYYSLSAFGNWAKPWDNRKYTFMLTGQVQYTNNIAYVSSVDSLTAAETTQKNVAKNIVFTPGTRFRLDIPDIIDAQALTTYSFNRTDNSIRNALTETGSNIRTWTLGLTGKNYLWKDWTVSYDFTRTVNMGYNVPVTNPNVFNAYVERRFLKNNAATIRAAVYDIFNENNGYTYTPTATSITQSEVNRLGRYYLLTFTLRLQKFAGRAPLPFDRGRPGRNGGHDGPGPGGGDPGGPPSGTDD